MPTSAIERIISNTKFVRYSSELRQLTRMYPANNVKYPRSDFIIMFVPPMTTSTAMTLTIPFSVEGSMSECTIELRDLSGRKIHRIFHGFCQPGIHSVEFDSASLAEELDAGIYALYVEIGEVSQTYPLQYMP